MASQTAAPPARRQDQQYHLSNPAGDTVDFGIGATKRRQATGLDNRRNRARFAPVIIMPLVILAIIAAIHWAPLLIKKYGPGPSRPVTPSKPAPFSFSGQGFSTCTAPTLATMRRWTGSEYRAIFVDVGGANMPCALGNLSASWVRSVRKLGWTVFPVYSGPQSPGWDGGDGVLIDPENAASEGRAAAADAISAAHRMEIPKNVPVFYDMEAYNSSDSSAVPAVLKFLSAWDASLNRAGFYTGVYSSEDSGIVDISAAVTSRAPNFTAPDVLFFALWDNNPSLSGPFPYPLDARVNEYAGNVDKTIGGDTLNVDLNIVSIQLTSLEPPH
jgi:hypothetical protein